MQGFAMVASQRIIIFSVYFHDFIHLINFIMLRDLTAQLIS